MCDTVLVARPEAELFGVLFTLTRRVGMKLLAFMNICSSYSPRETFAAALWYEMKGERADIIKDNDSDADIAAADELLKEVMAALHGGTGVNSEPPE